jgi:tetratricopeptide (TPR) repeat protein
VLRFGLRRASHRLLFQTPSIVKLLVYIISVSLGVSVLFRQLEWPWVAFRKGEAAFARGNYSIAALLYSQAAEKLDDPRILERLANCWLAAGHRNEAEAALVRVVEKHPEQLSAIKLLAGLYQQAQEPEKAIPLFTRYVGSGRKLDPPAELQLARVYRQAELYDEAAPYYLLAAQDQKQKDVAAIELAEMRSWQGSYNEAIALLRQVLLANPSNRQARLSLARILSWAGDYKESEDEYRKLLRKP